MRRNIKSYIRSKRYSKNELKKFGIDTDMCMILDNLGYKYQEMLKLSTEELDFIFPNTAGITKLVKKGYNE